MPSKTGLYVYEHNIKMNSGTKFESSGLLEKANIMNMDEITLLSAIGYVRSKLRHIQKYNTVKYAVAMRPILKTYDNQKFSMIFTLIEVAISCRNCVRELPHK